VVSAPYTIADKLDAGILASPLVIHGVAPWSNDVGYDYSVHYVAMEPEVSPEFASEVELVGVDANVVGAVSDGDTDVGGHDQNVRIAVAHVDDDAEVEVGVVAERGGNVGIADTAGDDPFCWSMTSCSLIYGIIRCQLSRELVKSNEERMESK
jgi:hypothetical protein